MPQISLEYLLDTSHPKPQLCVGTVIGVFLAVAFGIWCMYSSVTMRHKHVSGDQIQSVTLQQRVEANATR